MCSDPVNLCFGFLWILGDMNQNQSIIFCGELSDENHMRIFLNLRSFFEDSNFMFFGCDVNHP